MQKLIAVLLVVIAVTLIAIAVELFSINKQVGLYAADDGPWPGEIILPDGHLQVEKMPDHSKCKSIYGTLQYIACAEETELKLLEKRLH